MDKKKKKIMTYLVRLTPIEKKKNQKNKIMIMKTKK